MKLSKWKLFRRSVLLLSAFGFIGSVVLLLNITASNPTHRRYSSQMPITVGNSIAVGTDAERILSTDLGGQPRNDQPDQRQCICNRMSYTSYPMPSDCRVCVLNQVGLTASYRRPDFMSDGFIGESKNVLAMPYSDTDLLNQIGDYALAARSMNRPLWVYTRVNSVIDPEYDKMVNSTGGAIVRYFAVSGYVDPVDMVAHSALIASLGIFAVFGAWEVISRRGNSSNPGGSPVKRHGTTRSQSPTTSTRRSDPISGLDDALHRAQDAARQTRNKLD